jgi:hypothetical protein
MIKKLIAKGITRSWIFSVYTAKAPRCISK